MVELDAMLAGLPMELRGRIVGFLGCASLLADESHRRIGRWSMHLRRLKKAAHNLRQRKKMWQDDYDGHLEWGHSQEYTLCNLEDAIGYHRDNIVRMNAQCLYAHRKARKGNVWI